MIGKTISHYRIIEKLGEAAMGVVYRVKDTKLKRMVALELLPPELTRDPEALYDEIMAHKKGTIGKMMLAAKLMLKR